MGLDAEFWDLLESLEQRHRRAQSDYETVRRRLERIDPHLTAEFRDVWTRYCEVIAELDRSLVELARFQPLGI